MDKKSLENWLLGLSKVWEERNPQAVGALLAEEFEYYETPLGEPYTKKADVVELWKAVPKTQENVKCNFEILSVNDRYGLANFKVVLNQKATSEKYFGDRVFLISLNEEGLCTLFKQWRESRTEKPVGT